MQPPRMPADSPLEYHTRTRTRARADDASGLLTGGADIVPVRRPVDDDDDDDDTDDQDEPADEASAIACDDRRRCRFRHALRIQVRRKQSDSLAAVSASLDDFSFDHSRVQSAFVDAIPPKVEAPDAAEIVRR